MVIFGTTINAMNEIELQLNFGKDWIQVSTDPITEQEKAAIDTAIGIMQQSGDKGPLIQAIEATKITREKVPDPEIIQQAQDIYEKYFPDGATLVQAIITLPEGRGIINCRIGDEQKQIRW